MNVIQVYLVIWEQSGQCFSYLLGLLLKQAFTEIVIKAYIHGHDLYPDVYVRRTHELGLPSKVLLKLEKPLYGLSESGDFSYKSYSTFLKEKMQVTPTEGDTSFYFKSVEDKIIGLWRVYIDDKLAAGNKELEKETDKIPTQFESKPREFPAILFVGMNIEKTKQGYTLHQKRSLEKIELLNKDDRFEEFRRSRHRLAWITHTRPEILAGVNILSQITQDTFTNEHIKTTNMLTKHLKNNPNQSLNYNHIDKKSIHILIFSGGSFSGNDDSSSQIGYIIFICDEEGNTAPIDFSSTKSRRVVRSVLGAETFALANSCDTAIVLQHDLKQILKRTLKIKILTDTETLFNVMIKNANTTEKRLMIDIKAAREAYNEGIIEDIVWIRRQFNLAHAMTKAQINQDLVKALNTRKIKYEVEQCDKREVSKPKVHLN